MEKKYKLTDETIEFEGRTLYRIEALKDFYIGYNYYYIKIEKGDKGGFVQSEENLSQVGNCWLLPSETDNGLFITYPKICDKAQIFADALIVGSSEISGNAEVSDYALVIDSQISNTAKVFGASKVQNSTVLDNAIVYERCNIENSYILKNARVYDNARVKDSVIQDNAKVYDNAYIVDSFIDGDSKINCDEHIIENKLMINKD